MGSMPVPKMMPMISAVYVNMVTYEVVRSVTSSTDFTNLRIVPWLPLWYVALDANGNSLWKKYEQGLFWNLM